MSEQPPAKIGLDNHAEALSIWLDLFRWMAAFAVVLSHVSHRVFVRFHDVPHDLRSPMLYLTGGLSCWGEPAVILFFVMSGFLVGGGSLRRFRKTGVFLGTDYMLSRLTRLWMVLIPGMILTYVANRIGGDLFGGGAAGIYGPSDDYGIASYHDPVTFVCNAAFLQMAACYQYGGNGALWSLFNEFWYYVAWPPLMLALWSRGMVTKRVALFAAAIVPLAILDYFQFAGAPILLYFGVWLIGVVAADRDRPFVTMPPLAAAAVLIVGLLVWRVFTSGDVLGENVIEQFPSDMAMALLFANLVMNMKAAGSLRRPPLPRFHPWAAGFSFTLYVVHTPLIHLYCAIAVATLGIGWEMMPVGPTPFLMYAGGALFCVLGAYLMSRISEEHTMRVRGFVKSRLERHQPI